MLLTQWFKIPHYLNCLQASDMPGGLGLGRVQRRRFATLQLLQKGAPLGTFCWLRPTR